jgi:hypothetical protein
MVRLSESKNTTSQHLAKSNARADPSKPKRKGRIMKRIAAGFATLVLLASTARSQQGEVYGVILFAGDL